MAESSVENAIGAYMAAVAYQKNVDLFEVENPGSANGEEVEPDVYRILSNRGEADELVRAECTYHEITDEWTVEFYPPAPEKGDLLTVAWDEAAQQYTVMGGEEEPAG